MGQLLSGKRALVTGGTRGIGLAIARRLAQQGASVVICGRSSGSVEQAIEDLRASDAKVTGMPADVGDDAQVARLFEFADIELGGLDILVNNAGIGVFAPTRDLTVEQWRNVIDTNLTGVFLCSREALARFQNSGGGHIINISSLAGKHAFAGGAAYNASKFALTGFSEAMMADHRHEGVRVTNLMPGSVNTHFSSGGDHDWKVQPEDIAEIVLDILGMPDRTLISAVEVRPSRPQKKR